MPAKAGIQTKRIYLIKLDSRLHGNDGQVLCRTFYAVVNKGFFNNGCVAPQ